MDRTLFDFVCEHAREATRLQTAADALEWDERTRMPHQAGEYRAEQISALRGIVHRLSTDPKYAEGVLKLYEQVGPLDPQSDEAVTIRELHRDLERDRKLSTELVQAISNATVRGQQTWDKARREDSFAHFQPALEHILKLKREQGECLASGTDRTRYEALLDEYEPGARVEQLETVFAELRKPLVALIQRCRESSQQPSAELLQRGYPVDGQRELSLEVARAVGFDFERGRLDETSHPFCTTLGPSDCRILTRYETNWLSSGLYGTLHEAGHGMYEQGLRQEWFGFGPGAYASLGIHESQSRLWENQVGRSFAFCEWLLPKIQSTFGPTASDATVEDLYGAVNVVRPSLIRVEADEATYNLHIIIRFDLERALIDETLSVVDLPDAWNGRYESDLGIVPPSNASGVLQDVHWSAGLIGYFPTYTLGNLASAQLFDAACRDLGDLSGDFGRGDFGALLAWLRTNVHAQGRRWSSEDLVERATGTRLTAASLVGYLEQKLTPLYH